MRYRSRWALVLCAFLGVGFVGGNLSAVAWMDNDVITNQTILADDGGGSTIVNELSIEGDITIDGDVVISNTHQKTDDNDFFPVYIDADSFLHPTSGSSTGYGHLIFYNDECCQTMVFVNNDLIFTGSNWDDRHVNNRELTITFSGKGQVVFHIGTGKQVGFEGFFGSDFTGWDRYFDDYTKTGSGVMAYITMDQSYECAIENGANKVIFERYYDFNDTLDDPSLSNTSDSVKISIGKNSFITYISTNDSGVLSCDGTGDCYGSLAFDPSCYGAGRMLLHLKGSYFVQNDVLSGIVDGYNDGALVVAGHYVESFETPDAIRLGVHLNKPAGVEAILRIIDEQAWRNDSGYYQSSGELNLHPATEEPVLNGGSLDGKPSRRGLLVVNECKSIATFAADTYVNNAWANEYIFKTLGKGSSSIRPGFILGVNGHMELFHNTFLDYVAASTMKVNVTELDWTGAEIDSVNIKKHNPSALVVDGISVHNLANFDPADPLYSMYPENALHYPYEADLASLGGRHAQIQLRGDSRLYLRSGVMKNGYVPGLDSMRTNNGLGGYFVGLDRTYSFTINFDDSEGSYDGSFLSGYADHGGMTNETVGEGNHVLDVEGKLTIRSTDDVNLTNESGFVIHRQNRSVAPGACCFSRHALTGADARGLLNVPPLKLDYMGREISNDILWLVEHPLSVGRVYPCYNSSSLFFNAEMALHNINWHHDDLLKVATPEQDKSEPAVVGGEKAAFDHFYWSSVATGTADTLFLDNPVELINTKVPLISLYSTVIHLHESLVSTGVRFVVTDKFWYNPDDQFGNPQLVSNTSILMCYNHGDELDMLKRGYGRTFGIGSQQNKMSDGVVLNEFTQNGYLNIYRSWNTDGNAGIWGDGYYLVRFSLETDVQPKFVGQYETRTNVPEGDFSRLLHFGVDQFKRVATQVFYLGNNSFSSVGWTTTTGDQVISLDDMRDLVNSNDGSYSYSYGINEGFRPRPWDAIWGLGDRFPIDLDEVDPIPQNDFRFSLTSAANDPAELYINGDGYYFGGRDASGNVATEPVVAANESCIFYTNHGGKTHINKETLSIDQDHYYDAFVDTIFAYRPWPRIWDASYGAYIDGLSGIIDLPHDQVKFGRSIQPYNIDFRTLLLDESADTNVPAPGRIKERNLRLSVYDEKLYGISPVSSRDASGEEVSIAWNFRTDKSVRVGAYETSPTYTPVKTLTPLGFDPKSEAFASLIYKSTKQAEDVGPAEMPEAVLTVSTGDNITQMRVSGATKADPFHLYVTGGHQGRGVVREFTSLDSNYFNPGEGCHAAILIDGGGFVGLGTRHWNEHSTKAWSVLGHDYVTLYPNGQSFVMVNSDLIVADRLAIIPTRNFGSVDGDKQVIVHRDSDQRITFFSDVPREIRIPAGGELDLSAFGRIFGTQAEGRAFPQQIEFAGQLRLVFEPGARLRFPSNPDVQPVLYMNDQTQLVFEGLVDRDRENWTSWQGADEVRSKIIGVGQIWLNKEAIMTVNDTSLVGIETDYETDTTDITISIRRQGTMFIGNDNLAGGGFQVGNPVDRSGSISFSLLIGDPQARLMLRREGFFGLGVGTVFKSGAPNSGWILRGLYNVDNIAIDIDDGIFDHSQIFDGRSSSGAVMAVGPAASYSLSLGSDEESAVIRGGGNLLYYGTSGSDFTPSILSTAGDGTANGDYSILAPGHVIRRNPVTITSPTTFFRYLTFTPMLLQQVQKYVAFGQTKDERRIGYINGTTITRTNQFTIADGSNPEWSIALGALVASIHNNASSTAGQISSLTRSYR